MSKHFTRAELVRSKRAQELDIDNSPPDHVLANLDVTMAGCERVRAFLGHRMIISSGFRCEKLNQAVGGSDKSQHLVGQAVDFTCPDFGGPVDICRALAPMLEVLGIDNLVLEGEWVHMSFTLDPRCRSSKYLGGGHFSPLPF